MLVVAAHSCFVSENLPALLQLVVGALVGAAITILVKRDEYRRALADRWDVDKRRAYADFLRDANSYERAVFVLRAECSEPAAVSPVKLDNAFEAMQRSLSEVMLIGGAVVARSAFWYAEALVPAFGKLDAGHDRGPYGWGDVDLDGDGPGSVMRTRGEYVQSVRRELGLRADQEPHWNSFASVR